MQLRSQTGYTLVLEHASDFVLAWLTCTCLVPLIGRMNATSLFFLCLCSQLR